MIVLAVFQAVFASVPPPPLFAIAQLEHVRGESFEFSLRPLRDAQIDHVSIEFTLHCPGEPDLSWSSSPTLPVAASLTVPVQMPSSLPLCSAGSVPSVLTAIVYVESAGQRGILTTEPVEVSGEPLTPTTRTIGGIEVLDIRTTHTLGAVPSVDGDMEVEDASE